MEFAFKRRAADVFSQAVADVLTPADELTPSQWAEAHLTVPDGPLAGQKFSLALAEYLREPLDMLGPDSPVNEIAVMKSAQTGFTTMLIAAIGFMIDRAPCNALLVQPTQDALSDFNRLKLDPAIQASPAPQRKVATRPHARAQGQLCTIRRFQGALLRLPSPAQQLTCAQKQSEFCCETKSTNIRMISTGRAVRLKFPMAA
jgi:phage terminase large subunit GpA-like protein